MGVKFKQYTPGISWARDKWLVRWHEIYGGRYDLYEEAEAALAKLKAEHKDVKKPAKRGNPAISITKTSDGYRLIYRGHFVGVYAARDKAEGEARRLERRTAKHTEAMGERVVRKETAADRAACAKCKWRRAYNNDTDHPQYMCGYSLDELNRSRVSLHYERTGKQSLEGFTFGADCTEYEPKAKKRSVQVKKRKAQSKMAAVDLKKFSALRREHTLAEIAEAAGCSLSNIGRVHDTHVIANAHAEGIAKKFGVDVRSDSNGDGSGDAGGGGRQAAEGMA